MVSIPETRELFVVLTLIAGLSGTSLFFDAATSIATPMVPQLALPQRIETGLVFVANPVVRINLPEHNVFAP